MKLSVAVYVGVCFHAIMCVIEAKRLRYVTAQIRTPSEMFSLVSLVSTLWFEPGP